MSTSVSSQIEAARGLLRQLVDETRALGSVNEDVLSDPEVARRMERFSVAAEEAFDRLEHPSLSLATIGTTSSGKSTIVNALLGRRIAPIEAGEMSAGVLAVRASAVRRLSVVGGDGCPWETGDWLDISDSEVYNRIRNGVMRPYHDARGKGECLAPEIAASGPMLPVADRDLLRLPPGIAVELIDLPGLKSVQDRGNLAVIQQRVHKAFSLVALDYLQTDDLNMYWPSVNRTLGWVA